MILPLIPLLIQLGFPITHTLLVASLLAPNSLLQLPRME
jgi:hypothetical protein